MLDGEIFEVINNAQLYVKGHLKIIAKGDLFQLLFSVSNFQ